MSHKPDYDAAIIGGGLAGLPCAILLRRMGHTVILIEKERYPFHRVCGEYVSLESIPFLESLGMPVNEMNLPLINTLVLTSPGGKTFTTKLPQGGIGISRHLLDSQLAELAQANGVVLLQGTKVDAVQHEDGCFSLTSNSGTVTARCCLAAFGKKSNLDVKWDRDFLKSPHSRLHNYVGVKYHLHAHWAENAIGLHNFENGYCGISKIEDNRYSLCYMTTSAALKKEGGISQLEKNVLWRNPHLKSIFSGSTFSEGFPITISQISFEEKTRSENGVLAIGDAAGMITPLCGNGMSIALHTGKIAAALSSRFLQGELTKERMEEEYEQEWNKHFARRLRTGRTLQRFLGSSRLSNGLVSAFRLFPILAGPVVRMTHGKPF